MSGPWGDTDSVTVVAGDIDAPPAEGEPRSILVMSQNFVATYALPESGEVTIGRSNTVEIYVDDPLVSRRHAILSIAAQPTIRDLGSSNGTRVSGTELAPGERHGLAIGDVVVVGSAALLIQRGGASVHPRRFWAQDQFEARLNEECARAERSGRGFAVVCLHVGRHAPEVVVRQSLAATMRTSDIVGTYGSGGYALLLDANAEQANVVVERLSTDLGRHDITARWGVGHYPTDGTTGEQLLASARPAADDHTAEPSVVEGTVISDVTTQELYRVAERIASGDISVLIVGETGVGKEVMAEEIHRRSARAARPFLRLNCAALSESLLESELFGHERGAFTSAMAVKPGLLETADGGVVLLDEIGEMPMTLQVKLLRVLEEKQVRRVGGVKSRPLDVRFLAATNRDLEAHASRGLFRQDLYYRLAGATLSIPPLRDRPGDIEPLARAFLFRAAPHRERPATITPEALDFLRAHRWPGNVRELKHALERAVLLAGSAPITPAHLLVDKPQDRQRPETLLDEESADTREHILEVLAACGGNQSRAAKQLGMSRGALIRRLERYRIVRPRRPD